MEPGARALDEFFKKNVSQPCVHVPQLLLFRRFRGSFCFDQKAFTASTRLRQNLQNAAS